MVLRKKQYMYELWVQMDGKFSPSVKMNEVPAMPQAGLVRISEKNKFSPSGTLRVTNIRRASTVLWRMQKSERPCIQGALLGREDRMSRNRLTPTIPIVRY